MGSCSDVEHAEWRVPFSGLNRNYWPRERLLDFSLAFDPPYPSKASKRPLSRPHDGCVHLSPAIRHGILRVSQSNRSDPSVEGVGGIRHASFEGGVLFVETVDVWEPERRLAFSSHAECSNPKLRSGRACENWWAIVRCATRRVAIGRVDRWVHTAAFSEPGKGDDRF
jgi:hypothetical protein